jgi:hypothetical protein
VAPGTRHDLTAWSTGSNLTIRDGPVGQRLAAASQLALPIKFAPGPPLAVESREALLEVLDTPPETLAVVSQGLNSALQ